MSARPKRSFTIKEESNDNYSDYQCVIVTFLSIQYLHTRRFYIAQKEDNSQITLPWLPLSK